MPHPAARPMPPAPGTALLRFDPLTGGTLLRRYKRFLADVELEDGSVVTAHCPNTGPMTGVLHPGGRVRLRHAPSPKRKLAWTWEQAEVPGAAGDPVWVGINTALPNRLVRAAIEAGCLSGPLGPVERIRAEVPYGRDRRSRIDLLLQPPASASDDRPVYVEIKNTTWCDGALALFPDTVTERGQKHLRELMAVAETARAVLIPCLSRPDVERFAPGDSADAAYGELFRAALRGGVQVIPCRFRFEPDRVSWQGTCAVQTRQLAVL